MGLRLHDSPHRGINLRSSLTDRESTYSHSDSQASTYSLSSHETFESRSSKTEGTEGGRPCHNGKPMSQEDRLVDAVTTPGGVRLQPSREEVQNFLTAATKLDGDLLGYALLSKLQARLWQVTFLLLLCFALQEALELTFTDFKAGMKSLFLEVALLSCYCKAVMSCSRDRWVFVPGAFESHVYCGSRFATRRQS